MDQSDNNNNQDPNSKFTNPGTTPIDYSLIPQPLNPIPLDVPPLVFPQTQTQYPTQPVLTTLPQTTVQTTTVTPQTTIPISMNTIPAGINSGIPIQPSVQPMSSMQYNLNIPSVPVNTMNSLPQTYNQMVPSGYTIPNAAASLPMPSPYINPSGNYAMNPNGIPAVTNYVEPDDELPDFEGPKDFDYSEDFEEHPHKYHTTIDPTSDPVDIRRVFVPPAYPKPRSYWRIIDYKCCDFTVEELNLYRKSGSIMKYITNAISLCVLQIIVSIASLFFGSGTISILTIVGIILINDIKKGRKGADVMGIDIILEYLLWTMYKIIKKVNPSGI
ncbi:hypothetical protein WA158_004132 [Blastocystis sp. Blastoise]